MSRVLFLFLLFSPAVLGANILGVFSVTSYSHQIVYRKLMMELNRRGHSITIITPNPVRDPKLKNYREIDTSFFYKDWNEKMVADPVELRISLYIPEILWVMFTKISEEMCHAYLSAPEVQKLIRENPKFDLLITEFGVNPCLYGFARYAGYKHLGMWSFQASAIVHANIGNPATASYIPEVNFEYTDRMNFFQRFRVFVFQLSSWWFYWYIMQTQDGIAKKYFGEDLPNLVELERNLSALMVNTHFTMAYPRPYLPNVIEIGGPALHLIGNEPKPLTKDIKDFLDGATDGVIYFSLGTNVKTVNITGSEKVLMESFGRIKQRVLWKWENDDLVVDLKNVKKGKWFPQVEILAHPNVKGFVTQGGLQSIGEAIEYHVPMIVMPFFADQGHNARKMEMTGSAIYLNFDTLTVDQFTEALNQIVYNKTYKESIKKHSELVRDQPVPPLEKAVWWTEYVIRHDGAPHLRSAAATMPWYQYFLLDVLAFLFIVLFLILYTIYFLTRTLLRFAFKSKKPKRD